MCVCVCAWNVQKESSRGRGRPRLTVEEKQRRKELRELGLLKRSKRRTKEGERRKVWLATDITGVRGLLGKFCITLPFSILQV